ncbi:MAG: DUF4422 domain-containing protein [Staphylococcus epidermidis]|nr:DUF4422 domain-containing protein [Staphylococcus epidermidis]
MKIRIAIVSHKNISIPKMNGYQPIQVGQDRTNFSGYIRDNSEDNISIKNSNYCELTAQYWLWKNDNSDIKGLVHYRRYFRKNRSLNILNSEEIERILSKNDLILPQKRNYVIETNYSHYVHAHYSDGIDEARNVIKDLYPDYLKSFDEVMSQRKAHMFNMIIAKKDIFDSYSKWLFDVLSELEERVDISDWDDSESRIYGYVSELLLNVWIKKNGNFNIDYEKVLFIGNQKWVTKILNFLKRKIKGKKK